MNPKTRPLQLHVPGVDPFMVDIVNVLCLVPANQNSFLNLSPFFLKLYCQTILPFIKDKWNLDETRVRRPIVICFCP